MKQVKYIKKNYEMKNVKNDFANFLDFYLSQTMSLEEMDDWAKRLQKKWDLKSYVLKEYDDELKKG
tara:strand:- start:342 stop:539 length:198 start_codon:yes stop_codon:yes gene_type:complete